MTATKTRKYSKVTASGKVTTSGDVEEEVSMTRQNKKKSLSVPPQYLSLGTYLAAPLLIAVFVGQWLDKHFHTGALFTIVLLVFGTISVFYNLYKLYGGDEATHKHKG